MSLFFCVKGVGQEFLKGFLSIDASRSAKLIIYTLGLGLRPKIVSLFLAFAGFIIKNDKDSRLLNISIFTPSQWNSQGRSEPSLAPQSWHGSPYKR